MIETIPSTDIIEIDNWTKRRRAMITMLSNPFIPKTTRPYLYKTALNLTIKLIANGHPMCAKLVDKKLTEVKDNARRTGQSNNMVPNRWSQDNMGNG